MRWTRRLLASALAPLAALRAAGAAASMPGPPPLALRAMGSFHVGGREAVISGRPVKEVALRPGGPPVRIDPNGTYQVEAMYVQWFAPAEERGQAPLLLWHGGGMTGAAYETTPDGREGWQAWFLRRGWRVHVSDAVERGRAGFAPSPEVFEGEPLFLTKDVPWERFRIGPGPGSYAVRAALPGSQFPVGAYDALMRQFVPRWTTTDEAQLSAYRALLERVGPAVVIAHAQGAYFALRAAQERPAAVRALVLLEPVGFGEAPPAVLAGVPVLVVHGDHLGQDPRWAAIRDRGRDVVARLAASGGRAELLSLPERGLRGNGHLMMLERNSDAVAEAIQGWLAAQSLWR